MLKRLRSLFHPTVFYIVEATLIGLFFVQALRYLIGALYARAGSASLYPTLDPALIDPTLPGLVEPDVFVGELSFTAYMLFLPILAALFGRFRVLLVVGAVVAGAGRYLMTANFDLSPDVFGAALTVGGGLLYIVLLVRHRARVLPYMMILALSADQLFRAQGDTLDPSWSAAYLNTQLILMILVIALSLATFIWQSRLLSRQEDNAESRPDRGLMTFWGGIGFGALLFLQLSLLALPNAIARRADSPYTLIVPLVIIATLFPLLPYVRSRARKFIGLFDSGLRGWVWMLLAMLLLVFGIRFGGVVASVTLILAQAALSMMWWWFYRPQAEKERNASGIWLAVGLLVFVLLLVFDIFTYEYAFVRDFGPELDALNPLVPSLLRGFRGLGWVVILFAAFLAVLPMVMTQRRIAWMGAPVGRTYFAANIAVISLIVGAGAGAALLARPPIVLAENNPANVRVGTYNIHAGYNEFFYFDLDLMADTIAFSGARVVLLQEVETGRLTSYGVDQALWLARRLGMDVRFFPTNEGLQGLAVLSQVEIVFDDGTLLDSQGNQTGLQRVQIRPDDNVITIYNTWLEPLLDTGGTGTLAELESAQNEQLTQLIATIAAHHPDGRLGRMVLGGTFNNIPDSDVIRRVRNLGFEDPFEDEQARLAVTFQRTGIEARLDYLWTTQANNFQVVESGVINDLSREVLPRQASDHLLPVIDIRLR